MLASIGREIDSIDILCYQPSHFENAKEEQNALMQDLTSALCQQRVSGTSVKGRTLVSKRGHADLRKALYMPGMVAMRHNPLIKDMAQRLKTKGMAPKAIISAAMHKLVHLIYGVLKTRQSFDANWTKNVTEVIETAVSVVVPVKINVLALDFQDGIWPQGFPTRMVSSSAASLTNCCLPVRSPNQKGSMD